MAKCMAGSSLPWLGSFQQHNITKISKEVIYFINRTKNFSFQMKYIKSSSRIQQQIFSPITSKMYSVSLSRILHLNKKFTAEQKIWKHASNHKHHKLLDVLGTFLSISSSNWPLDSHKYSYHKCQQQFKYCTSLLTTLPYHNAWIFESLDTGVAQDVYWLGFIHEV